MTFNTYVQDFNDSADYNDFSLPMFTAECLSHSPLFWCIFTTCLLYSFIFTCLTLHKRQKYLWFLQIKIDLSLHPKFVWNWKFISFVYLYFDFILPLIFILIYTTYIPNLSYFASCFTLKVFWNWVLNDRHFFV